MALVMRPKCSVPSSCHGLPIRGSRLSPQYSAIVMLCMTLPSPPISRMRPCSLIGASGSPRMIARSFRNTSMSMSALVYTVMLYCTGR